MDQVKPKERTHKGLHAKVSAKWIPVLRHFMSDLNEEDSYRPRTHGLHIEPHPEGGITVMATNGSMMAVVHDKEGETTKPVRVMIPTSIADACEPPKLPLFFSEGDWLPPPEVPAWMSPQWLRIWEFAAWVEPAYNDAPGLLAHSMIDDSNEWRIGEQYRIQDGEPLPWKQCMPPEGEKGDMPLKVSPLLLGRISIAAHKAGAKVIRVTGAGEEKPIRVEFDEVPEITVVLIPVR